MTEEKPDKFDPPLDYSDMEYLDQELPDLPGFERQELISGHLIFTPVYTGLDKLIYSDCEKCRYGRLVLFLTAAVLLSVNGWLLLLIAERVS